MRPVSLCTLTAIAAAIATVVGVSACGPGPVPTGPADPQTLAAPVAGRWTGGAKRYLVVMHGDEFPADFAAQVAAAGGRLTATLTKAGVALARSDATDFAQQAGRIAGVQGVAEDRVEQWLPANLRVHQLASRTGDSPGGQGIGTSETLLPFQWAPQAIHAPEAWQTGAVGEGVRIAILDGGIHDQHIDIAPNLDAAHSTSFALDPNGNPIPFNQDVGTFWHGTHVAGIAAAPAQGLGTVGIAPRATIIGVKVLHNGSGTFGAVIQAIFYAATPIAEGGAGADIINLSLGIPPTPFHGTDHLLAVALSKATPTPTSAASSCWLPPATSRPTSTTWRMPSCSPPSRRT